MRFRRSTRAVARARRSSSRPVTEPLEPRALLSVAPAGENAPPVSSGIPDVVVDEDAPDTVINLREFFEDDADPDEALAFTASTNKTSLFRLFRIDPDAGTLTMAYAVNASGTADVVARATDTQGAFGADTFSVTVNAVNDPPVNRVPGPQATLAGTALIFGGQGPNFLSVTDPDVGSGNLTITLRVEGPGGADAGTLSLASVGGLQFHQGDGTADAVMSFSGSGRLPGAMLSRLRYDPAPGFTGVATLTITSNDNGNTGSGGPQTDTDAVEIHVVPAPTVSVGDTSVVEGHTGLTPANVTVSLSAASPLPVSVRWATADGTARAGGGGEGGPAVPNGSFEDPAIGGNWAWVPAGSTIGPWVVESGSVDIVRMWQDADGEQSLDLSGAGAGAVYQDLATVPGRTYTLRFALAGNPEIRGDDRVKRMTVDVDGAPLDTLSFDTTGRTLTDMGWQYHSYALTATSTTTRLRFTSLNEIDTGPAIDDVKLVPVGAEDDYNAASGFLSFAPGETSKTVTVFVHGDTNVEPDETFFVDLSQPQGATVGTGRGTVTIVNDDVPPAPPPRVTGVFVSAPHWPQALKDYLGTGAAGFLVPAGPGGDPRPAQLASLPWFGLTQVSVRFDSDVLVGRDDLAVRGAAGPYALTTFAYDNASRTATWTLAAPFGPDRVTLELDADDGVRAAGPGGAPLDGEWDNDPGARPPRDYPSGDGAAGGDFVFRLNTLPGDVNADHQVNALDVAEVKRRLARAAGDGVSGDRAYSVFADVTGDARINALDVAAVKRALTRTLPAEPPPPVASSFAPSRQDSPTAELLSEM